MQHRRRRSHWITVLAATAIAAGVYGIWWWVVPQYGLMKLVRTSSHQHRRVTEARLANFAHAPVQTDGIAGNDTEDLDARAIATRLLFYLDGRNDSASLRGAGVAHLVRSESARAVRQLEKAARGDPHDASIWNDLAVARHALAGAEENPTLLADALSAVDRALAERPDFVEARFNAGVIFEAIGLHGAAIRSYEKYLELDATSAWSVEARQRITTLGRATSNETWKRDRALLERAVFAGDAMRVRALVSRYPQEARTSCETFDLPAWGQALEQNEEAKAAERLRVVKSVGETLSALHGDTSLADAVAAIERSSDSRRRVIARALVRYLEARTLYARGQVSAATPIMETVERDLAVAGNPMSIVAGYYHADVLIQGGKTDAALVKLRALQAATPQTHLAYRAQILWALAEAHVRRGILHDALRAQQESLAIFRNLREEKSTCAMLIRAAATLAVLGRRNEAWRLRVEAFGRLSRLGDARELQGALEVAARTEALDERWETALPLLAAATDPSLLASARVHASTLLWYALAEQRLGRSMGRERIEAAARAAAALNDPVMRSRALLDVILIEAISLRDRDPQRAVILLDRFLIEAAASGHSLFLPEAHYQRALAFLALREDRRAESDLRMVLELLAGRQTDRIEQRSTYFRTSDNAARELAQLLVSRGDAAGAFAVLGDARSAPYEKEMRSAPARTGVPIVEYLALRDRLLVFVANADEVTIHTVPVDEARLRETVRRFVNDIIEGTVSEAATKLTEWLIEPIPEQVRNEPLLAIVPDRAMAGVPFGALKTADGRFFIEQTAFFLAPANRLVAKPLPILSDTALIVGDPATDSDLPALPQARREALSVARRYETREVLIGKEATNERVRAAAERAGVLHFATHAVVVANDPLSSYLLMAPSDGSSGAMTVQDIHRATFTAAPLIVLAGCKTGASPDTAPRITNLAVAFLAAGATSVVGTLWDLPDDSLSSEISIRFHDQLRRGADPASALRAAQLAMLRSGDPNRMKVSTWGAFQLWTAAKTQ